MSDWHHSHRHFAILLEPGEILKSTPYSTQYHSLQPSNNWADTWVRFPSLRELFRAFKPHICAIFKSLYLQFYAWAKSGTFDHLIRLVSVQACHRQLNPWVRCSWSRAPFSGFERPLCSIVNSLYSHLHTWADSWFIGNLRWLPRLQASDSQLEPFARLPSLRATSSTFKPPISTTFQGPYWHFYTWAEL